MLPATKMTCERCGEAITSRQAKRFCSRKCYHASRHPTVVPTFVCTACGVTTQRRFYAANQGYDYDQRYCSRACGYAAIRKGGHIDKAGYRVFNRGKTQEYEHRLVMARLLDRPLTKHETVHHKNGNRLDNRPENLELWSSRHGRGQRVTDRIEDARAFLAEHGHTLETFTTSDAIRGVLACV